MSQELRFFLPVKAVKEVWTLNNGEVFPKITFGFTKMEGFTNIYNAVNCALTHGYRAFDCSPRNNGEENLGRALEELLPLHNLERKDIVLSSKVIPKNYGKHLTREAFLKSCENLKTDYIDTFFMEWPGGYKVDPESVQNIHLRLETWDEITVLTNSGVIKTAGVCHFHKRHLESIRKKGLLVPAVNQVEFHPQCPQVELSKYCDERNIQLQAACQAETLNPLLLEEDNVKEVAKNLNKTPTQIILKWIINKGVGVIINSESASKTDANFEFSDVVLEKSEMDILNSIPTREKYLRSSVFVI